MTHTHERIPFAGRFWLCYFGLFCLALAWITT